MQVLVIANESIFRDALRSAREIGREGGMAPGVLNASIQDTEKTWLERIWGKVEYALNTSWLNGRQAAQEAIQEVHEDLVELTKALGNGARTVRDQVFARLSSFVQSTVQRLLACVQPSVKIGDRDLPIRTVTIEQKLTMSGSLKASLEEICEFVAEGELSLAADYGSAE